MRDRRSADGRIGILFIVAQREVMSAPQLHEAIMRRLDRRRFAVHAAVAEDFEGLESWAASLGRAPWVVPLGTSVSAATSRRERVARALASVRMASGLARTVRRVRDVGIDVVHAETRPRDALTAVTVAALGRARLVAHWHNAHPLAEFPWARLAFRRAAAVVAISDVSRQALLDAGVPERKIHVIHNGIDVERFRPPDPSERQAVRVGLGLGDATFVVVLPGRLTPEKGQTELLRAVALLRDRGDDVVAVLLGADNPGRWGGQREVLEALRDELGIADRVRFVGHRPDVPAVLGAADVVAVPSHREPFGLVVIEAMACGRPVVGTAAGAIPEILDDGQTGLLVEPEDPAALAGALARLRADPGLRARLSAGARATAVRRFSDERMVTELTALYEELAGVSRR